MISVTIIDDVLLGRVYTPLSRICGERFGSTAGSLARACIAPMVVFHTIRAITAGLAPPVSSATSIGLQVLMGLAVATVFWLQASRADQTPNPYEFESPPWRLLWVFLTVIFLPGEFGWGPIHDTAAVIDNIATISYIYFRAVPAPPPKKRRQPSIWFAKAGFEHAL